MKKFFSITFVCLIGLGVMFVVLMRRMEKEVPKLPPTILPSAILQVGDNRHLIVELATTPEEQKQGLSDRTSLKDGHGMLFLMGKSQIQTFWMNKMNFPLDIIFINNGLVTDIHANVFPPSQTSGIPAIVRSHDGADEVLEIKAGAAKEMGIENGTMMTLINSD
jgi:uncharacterized protein